MSPAVAHVSELSRARAAQDAPCAADACARAYAHSFYYYYFSGDAAEAGDRFTGLSFGDAQLTL